MIVAEKIQAHLQKLPISLQVEVLDFVEYLLTKWERETLDENQPAVSNLSLALAMRGMEDEEVPTYTVDVELSVTLERIAHFQAQIAYLRQMETNPVNYHAAVSGFLAEVDRMQLEVREYLSIHPTELAAPILQPS